MQRLSKGFTLIEVVIVVALFVAVSLALSELYLHFNALYGYQYVLVNTSSSAGRVINETEAIALPADQVLASHVFSTGTYSSGTNALVVEMPSIDSTGKPIANDYDYEAIYVSGTSAWRRLEANGASSRTTGTKLLSDSISSLTFNYDNADFTQVKRVTVDVVTSAAQKNNTAQNHLSETVYLRNK